MINPKLYSPKDNPRYVRLRMLRIQIILRTMKIKYMKEKMEETKERIRKLAWKINH